MFNIGYFRDRLNTDIIGKPHIIYYSEVGSTNDVAVNQGKVGEVKEGTLYLAEHQTVGRGRYGRTWEAPKGRCILASVVFRLRLKHDQVHLPNLIGALSIAQGIKGYIDLEALIKHPNDVRIEGKKVAGVLTEMYYDLNGRPFFVLGFGVNVNTTQSEFPEKLRENSTSVLLAALESKDKVVLCQVINDLYIGRGNIAPTNRSTHHLGVDSTVVYGSTHHLGVDSTVVCRQTLLLHILKRLEVNYLLLKSDEIDLISEEVKLWEEKD